MHHSISYIDKNFHFNRLILLGVKQENKSGCFFLNTVYLTVRKPCIVIVFSQVFSS